MSCSTRQDEIRLEIEAFNRRVITESFNRTVCEFLARELDPSSNQKTLIFCANDAHRDLVVKFVKRRLCRTIRQRRRRRRHQNHRQSRPAIAIDSPLQKRTDAQCCRYRRPADHRRRRAGNLQSGLLRRVNSRILFDQMLGRATRLCDGIGKETFRIFDAVRIYEALQGMTAMQPVVVNPNISFTQLAEELGQLTDEAASDLVREQFVAKLQRKKHTLTEKRARKISRPSPEWNPRFHPPVAPDAIN
ncbi:MAG: hypothetical protein U0X75_12990 [Acidobacteriota bacterium]